MKRKTKETIWEILVLLSIFCMIGFTGSYEQGAFTSAQYIAHAIGASVVAVISVIALRVMEASTNE